ncbi:uncharacterized protein LOC124686515 isoform X1 [Lolium rigidum]|uniref:uncharacterized protein LOC124686515 isoform X1 n=2 Tax=Lolium rigidum TaxID=89674 RepID=UPI001F5C19EB|nr:uncharacterized protein LOC124686515 isoform X1 [Lolium rigidum]XP_047076399.1 uncharacterized protein LOC124686515 isoform X1 [Lolium rigidum]
MAAEVVNLPAIEPQCKATIQSRFSTLRFMKVVKQFNAIQKSFISKHHLENLLKLPEHLMVPLHLQQWLLDYTSYGQRKFFQHKEKIIFFTKDIVDKVFGFPLGTKPFVMDSSDPDIIIEVEQLLAQYKQGRKTIPVKVLVSILLGANSEEVFIRSFILFFITTVLCPSTYNFVNPKYLYCLRDIDIPEVGNLDFGTLCLNHLWYEMDAWKDKIFMNTGDFNRLTWIGGCLPLLAVLYLDFLDFNDNAPPLIIVCLGCPSSEMKISPIS